MKKDYKEKSAASVRARMREVRRAMDEHLTPAGRNASIFTTSGA